MDELQTIWRDEIPPGHDLIVSVPKAASRCRLKAQDLRDLLAKGPWVRLGLYTWASYASSTTVVLRQFDRHDLYGMPIEVES